MTRNEVESIRSTLERSPLAAMPLLHGLSIHLKEGRVEPKAIYSAIHLLGDGGFKQARDVVADFLKSPEPELRHIALSVLVLHWGMPQYLSTCEAFFVSDSDIHVRAIAASCLGTLRKGMRDPRILKQLADVVSDSREDEVVRTDSYLAILSILGEASATAVDGTRLLKFPEDIDWNIVDAAKNVK